MLVAKYVKQRKMRDTDRYLRYAVLMPFGVDGSTDEPDRPYLSDPDQFAVPSPSKAWPETVKPISVSGLTQFGVDDRGALYWDGQRVSGKWLDLSPSQRIIGLLSATGIFLSGCAAVIHSIIR
jgi:hypothetical protein